MSQHSSKLYVILIFVLLFFTEVTKANELDSEWKKNLLEFETWYKQRNPSITQISLGTRDAVPHILGNYTMYSLVSDIAEGTKIYDAPPELTISAQTALKSRIGLAIKKKPELNQLTDLELIALYLLYNRKCLTKDEVSFWRSYVKVLPDSKDLNHILLMSPKEIEILKGSFGYNKAIETVQSFEKTYTLLERVLFSDENLNELISCPHLNIDDFKWAMATTLGRANYFVDLNIPLEEGKSRESFPVILPYFDMIGHYPTASPFYGRTKEGIYHGELEYKTDKQEVLRGIEGGCNSNIFVKRGLAHFDTVHPCATLPKSFLDRLNSLPTTPELEKQQNLRIEKMLKEGMKLDVFHIFAASVSQELLLITEIKLMTLEDFEAADSDNIEVFEQAADRVRIRALSWLAENIRSYLQTFPTTIDQDLVYMKSPEFNALSRRAQIAFKVVLEEKTVLDTFAKEMVAALEAPEDGEEDEENQEL